MSDGILILALFAGIGELCLTLTLKTRKKNQGFLVQDIKTPKESLCFL